MSRLPPAALAGIVAALVIVGAVVFALLSGGLEGSSCPSPSAAASGATCAATPTPS